MRRRHDMAAYYRFLDGAHKYFSSLRPLDVGLSGSGGLSRLGRAVRCGYNPNLPPSSLQNDRECGRCLVCRERHAKKASAMVMRSLLRNPVHRHYSVCLSLPKSIPGFPSLDGSIGELLYVPSALLAWEGRQALGMNRVLAGLRRAAVGAVADCFPGMKLGMLVGLHLTNDYMQFSPHVHLVLCGTMLKEELWPLDMDADGGFPGLAEAWRCGLGGRRGRPVRVFQKALGRAWASRLGGYVAGTFQGFRTAFREGLETENLAYNTLKAMDEAEVARLGDAVSAGVMEDKACVHVRLIDRNGATGELDPAGGMRFVVRYAMRPAFSKLEFRDLGGGMVSAGFWKDRERRSCGKTAVLFRRVLQACSVSRLRSYERYGFYAPLAGGGKARRDALLAEMDKGYPGRNSVGLLT